MWTRIQSASLSHYRLSLQTELGTDIARWLLGLAEVAFIVYLYGKYTSKKCEVCRPRDDSQRVPR